MQQQASGSRKLNEVVNTLYLTVLSRFPTDRELETAKAYANSEKASRREAAIDLTWALINTSEFLYRH